ncbi:MAG: hypothetical protein COB02_17095 [Candidatus Cloacimonadota bacterium]|nr:MAG: hypothetical protein COB02_17095 [Candidatus Cloacimonadota bacterium]
MSNGNIFSESWYRVANLNISLVYSISIQKQCYRGSDWYVLHDPFNNKFFRIRPEAYEFVARLDSNKTVEQVWEECLSMFPEECPTQDEVIRLLSQLHYVNLLFYKNRPNSDDIFKRFSDKKQRELGNKLFTFLYFRIPVWDPEVWLQKSKFIINLMFSKLGAIIWFTVLFLGIKSLAENYEALYLQTQGLLSPSNLGLLYVSMMGIKFLHELGHAMMTNKFGGAVHTVGIMFLVFTPLPYMDASTSWSFRNKWHRFLVGSAGMIVELFIASLAAIFWANSGNGAVNSIAFNLMVIGSVSSIIFNGNPLTKLDSYYMLSDILEIPNLYERSRLQWYYLIEKYIYGVEQNYSPSKTKGEGFWLLLYGIASSFYRILISVGIALFVADQWLELGVIIIIISISMYIIKPSYSFFTYLFTDQKLERVRKRAVFTSFTFIALLVFVIGFIPFSNNVYAPGIIHSNDFVHVFTSAGGFLEKLNVSNGQKVKKGEVLLSLKNDELNFDINVVQAQLEESYAQRKKVTKTSIADLKPLQERILFLKSKYKLLLSNKEKLNIKAVTSGIWYSNHLDQLKETWILPHRELGSIVPTSNFGFLAIITQGESFDIFKQKKVVGNIKLRGLVEHTIEPTEIKVLPYEKFKLPSPALGWYGGGEIAVGQKDGVTALESFFEVRVKLEKSDVNKYFLQGRVGTLRIRLDDQTIFEGFYKFLKQLMQKRYAI